LTHSASALHFLIETVGEEHVLLGSDYPLTWAMRTRWDRRAVLEDQRMRRLVCGATACGLIGLAPRA